MSRKGITTLQAGDFAGLAALEALVLKSNSLTALPGNVFDDLAALGFLFLNDNGLTALPENVFDDLAALKVLDLNGNSLTALPGNVFDDLAALKALDLKGNSLTALPENVFDGLSELGDLHLNDNSLRALPAGIFNDLMALQSLSLHNNPGSDGFVPIAHAGPDQAAATGQAVTLRATASEIDPWGNNVAYAWTQSDSSGNAVNLVDAATAQPSFVMPAGAVDLEFELRVTGRGGASYLGTDSVVVSVLATRVAVSSDPVAGGTYFLGEAIELTLRFNRPVVVDATGGTPSIELDVGGERRRADYVRGSDSRQLVFAYVVQSGDKDANGIRICGAGELAGCTGAVSLNDGTMQYRSGLDALRRHLSQADQRGHRVDGFQTGLNGGICDRTQAVRDALVELIPAAADCSEVTTAQLEGLTNFLPLGERGITTLKPGDFADLIALRELMLNDNSLEALPTGVFTGLIALRRLFLNDNSLEELQAGVFTGLTTLKALTLNNNGLTTLHAGVLSSLAALEVLYLNDNGLTALPGNVFDDLAALEVLYLYDNSLMALPAGIFSDLRALRSLLLYVNPGSDGFVPIAHAGPDQAVAIGQTVTLRATASEIDPWGNNVAYAWTQSDSSGNAVNLVDAATAQPRFVTPAGAAELEFELRVTGRGGASYLGTDSVVVASVLATRVAVTSDPVAGDTYFLGEAIELTLRFNRPAVVDATGGTPSIELDIGGERRRADYVRGSDSRHLVFAYTVQSGDEDTNGISICGAGQLPGCTGAISLNEGAIEGRDGIGASLRHSTQAEQSGHKVDGSRTGLSGGICGRTKAVRDELVELISAAADCSQVTADQLRSLTGVLSLEERGITTLRPGDFADLIALQQLSLWSNSLRTLPVGVFSDLRALRRLSLLRNGLTELPKGVFTGLTTLVSLELSYNGLTTLSAGVFSDLRVLQQLFLDNNRLTELPREVFAGLRMLDILRLHTNSLTKLPAGIFSGLSPLHELRLANNSLTTLPAGIFNDLVRLQILSLQGNPGSGDFRPIANAGIDQAVEVGQVVTLRAEASDADPWGDNVRYAWRQADNSGSVVNLVDDDSAQASFIMPADAVELEFEIAVTGRGGFLDTDTVVIASVFATGVAVTSDPVAGDTYSLGEAIELTLTFNHPVVVDATGGTPSIELDIGGERRLADYVRGSDSRQLVFAYTVQSGDEDTNGISICGAGQLPGCRETISLNGGTIESRLSLGVNLGHPTQAEQSGHKVDGSRRLSDLCGRTQAVRFALMSRLSVADCSGVTIAQLEGLIGKLSLAGRDITTLKPGDFADLIGLQRLFLNDNSLTALPENVFDGLAALESLNLQGNSLTALSRNDFADFIGLRRLFLHDNSLETLTAGVFTGLTTLVLLTLNDNSLTTLHADTFAGLAALEFLRLGFNGLTALPENVFDGLSELRELHLNDNSLRALPAGIFSDLMALQSLLLHNNPGSDGFVPIAHAGPDQAVATGQAVTLRATASEIDPWGNNVAYAWTQSDSSGNAVNLVSAATAQPSFVMPAGAVDLEFELRVTGRGGASYLGTDSVVVSVLATRVAVSSAPVAGDTYFLGEAIELTLRFNRPVVVDATGGTPSIELDIGGERRRADYVRGSDSRQLVFAYTVQSGDEDTNGISICGSGQLPGCTGAISLNEGAIEGRDGIGAILRHPTQAEQSGHKVDGSRTRPSGICGRTKAVRDALMSRLGAAHCSVVTAAQLRRLTGDLYLIHSNIATLKPGDFADLIGLQRLFLHYNSLTALPENVFDGLAALEALQLSDNSLSTLSEDVFAGLTALKNLSLYRNSLTTLHAGTFAGLAALELLHLGYNGLTALPENVFDGLAALEALQLNDNSLSTLSEDVFAGLTALERLLLNNNSLTTLHADTFAGLAALGLLHLGYNGLTALPENVFDGLAALKSLLLNNNSLTTLHADTFAGLIVLELLHLGYNGLTALPENVFDGLAALESLRLNDNSLMALPAGIFSDLRALQFLSLHNNPGSDGFVPIAHAGPDQAVATGQAVTLRATASGIDPWGNNVAYAWTQSDSSGNAVNLVSAATAQPSFVMPAGAVELEFELRVTGRGGASYLGTDSVVVASVLATGVAVTSDPVAGNTYYLGEAIELTLRFNRLVVVDATGGTPSIELDIGGERRRADYVRGSDSRQLVFAYTVQSGDEDTNGISICGAGQLPGCTGAISLNEGAIEGRPGLGVNLRHPTQAEQSGDKVDGSRTRPSGICGRTRAVRDALMSRLGAAHCSEVTTAQLGRLDGHLSLISKNVGTLKPGDFADLIALEELVLRGNRLEALPAGVFTGLTALEVLNLDYNGLTALSENVFDGLAALEALDLRGNSLTALPGNVFDDLAALGFLYLNDNGLTALLENVFDGLSELRELHLKGNSLTALPAGIFNDLMALQFLSLHNNPGSDGFVPIAHAGPDQAAAPGQAVTLRATASEIDPWGNNVAYAWTQSDSSGNAVNLVDAATAQPRFVTPAGAVDLEFELRVTGRGGASYLGTDSVVVSVLATRVAVSSDPVAGDTYFLGEAIELTLSFNRPVVVDATGGTPSIELDIGGERRRADYVRGSDSRQLVFAYTVQSGDEDTNGISICGSGQLPGCTGAISLNGGAIEGRDDFGVNLRHPMQAEQSGHKVDGSRTGLNGGICGRTKAVRDGLLMRIRSASNCSEVTATQLEGLTGFLFLRGITTLKPGDFADLIGLQRLFLYDNSLEALPAGVFTGLTTLERLALNNNSLSTLSKDVFAGLAELEVLYLHDNGLSTLSKDVFAGLTALRKLTLYSNSLTTLHAGIFSGLAALGTLRLNDNGLTALPGNVFDDLAALRVLYLNDNSLMALPAGIFSDLSDLGLLFLENNPGSEGFLPVANAGADQAAEVGQIATLGAMVSDTDPWGDNVTYVWALTESSGNAIELVGADSASPSFAIPADAAASELEFELTVTGRGGDRYTDTDTVMVRLLIPDTVVTLSGPVPMDTTDIVGDELSLVYSYSADDLRDRALNDSIEVSATVDGAVMPTIFHFSDRARGRGKITIVLRRETYPGLGEYLLAVTLSLSATATGFALGDPSSITTPFNFLPPTRVAVISDPVVGDTYFLGETIELTLTYDRAAVVDATGGTPSIELDIGGERRRADYVRGSDSRQLVFAYTVQSGDEDTNGISICGAGQLPGCTGAISLNGGTIEGRDDFGVDLHHPMQAEQSGHKVDGSRTGLSGGICGRTKAVRDALVMRIRSARNCSQVRVAQLEGFNGTLYLGGRGITTLKPGDFADLIGLQQLDLNGNSLEALPAGVFTGLPALEFLNLYSNSLTILPAGIFSELRALRFLYLENNPGPADFQIIANAGADRAVVAGQTVTLRATVSDINLWGDNVHYVWRRTDLSGSVVNLANADSAQASFIMPAGAVEVEFGVTVNGAFIVNSPLFFDTDRVVIVSVLATSVAVLSVPVAGDTYFLGEAIELALRFNRPVVVDGTGGTPSIELDIGDVRRQADYVRSSDSRQLVFAYTVQSDDEDTNGISICGAGQLPGCTGAISLNEGAIEDRDVIGVISLRYPTQAEQSGHKVDGSRTGLSSGICGRTKAVRDALVELIPAAADCSQVTADQLRSLTGSLNLAGRGIATLRPGDFAEITALRELKLFGNNLEVLPAGLFNGLFNLKILHLWDNLLAALPASVFSDLAELDSLYLQRNSLRGLPAGVFSDLSNLNLVLLDNNPGSEGFLPVANAGVDQVAEVGQTVTLRAIVSDTDPWGDNVTYVWALTESSGNAVELVGADSASPSFAMPADAAELEFELTVTGRGGDRYTDSDTVMVRLLIPDTVVTLSGPAPMDATNIVGDDLSLVYSYSAAELRGRVLSGSIGVTAAVDGIMITPASHSVDGAGGEITVVLRREAYPAPDEHELVVGLSALTAGFALGVPRSIATPFSFLPLPPTRLEIRQSEGNQGKQGAAGSDTIELGYSFDYAVDNRLNRPRKGLEIQVGFELCTDVGYSDCSGLEAASRTLPLDGSGSLTLRVDRTLVDLSIFGRADGDSIRHGRVLVSAGGGADFAAVAATTTFSFVVSDTVVTLSGPAPMDATNIVGDDLSLVYSYSAAELRGRVLSGSIGVTAAVDGIMITPASHSVDGAGGEITVVLRREAYPAPDEHELVVGLSALTAGFALGDPNSIATPFNFRPLPPTRLEIRQSEGNQGKQGAAGSDTIELGYSFDYAADNRLDRPREGLEIRVGFELCTDAGYNDCGGLEAASRTLTLDGSGSLTLRVDRTLVDLSIFGRVDGDSIRHGRVLVSAGGGVDFAAVAATTTFSFVVPATVVTLSGPLPADATDIAGDSISLVYSYSVAELRGRVLSGSIGVTAAVDGIMITPASHSVDGAGGEITVVLRREAYPAPDEHELVVGLSALTAGFALGVPSSVTTPFNFRPLPPTRLEIRQSEGNQGKQGAAGSDTIELGYSFDYAADNRLDRPRQGLDIRVGFELCTDAGYNDCGGLEAASRTLTLDGSGSLTLRVDRTLVDLSIFGRVDGDSIRHGRVLVSAGGGVDFAAVAATTTFSFVVSDTVVTLSGPAPMDATNIVGDDLSLVYSYSAAELRGRVLSGSIGVTAAVDGIMITPASHSVDGAGGEITVVLRREAYPAPDEHELVVGLSALTAGFALGAPRSITTPFNFRPLPPTRLEIRQSEGNQGKQGAAGSDTIELGYSFDYAADNRLDRPRQGLEIRVGFELCTDAGYNDCGGLEAASRTLTLDGSGSLTLRVDRTLVDLSIFGRADGDSIRHGRVLVSAGGGADFAAVAATTTFSFVVPATVVTLSGPLPADATDIAGDSISLVYSYSVAELRGRVLSGSIGVTAAVDGIMITPVSHSVDGAGGEITVVLRREAYPAPDEHELVVGLSALTAGFALGAPSSVTTPFNFRPLPPTRLEIRQSEGNQGKQGAAGSDTIELGYSFDYAADNRLDRPREGLEIRVGFELCTDVGYGDCGGLEAASRTLTLDGSGSLTLRVDRTLVDLSIFGRADGDSIRHGRVLVSAGGGADFAAVAATTTFSFVVSDTVVTLSGPLPADATDIAGDSISLVYSYSVAELRGRVLSGSIGLTAAVDGIMITPASHSVDGAGGEITVVLRREAYPAPDEHELVVGLSALTAGFALGAPRSVTTPFSFRPLPPTRLEIRQSEGNQGAAGSDTIEIGYSFDYAADNRLDRPRQGLEIRVGFELCTDAGYNDCGGLEAASRTLTLDGSGSLTLRVDRTLVDLSVFGRADGDSIRHGRVLVSAGGGADFAAVAATTTFSFVVSDTVVTLSGPLPADATDIAGDSISLVYSYSVAELRGRVLSGSIGVTAAVDGIMITPASHSVDGAGGEITVVLRREAYPAPDEHELVVGLSALTAGFALGAPRSVTTPFNFRPLPPTRLEIRQSEGNQGKQGAAGSDTIELGYSFDYAADNRLNRPRKDLEIRVGFELCTDVGYGDCSGLEAASRTLPLDGSGSLTLRVDRTLVGLSVFGRADGDSIRHGRVLVSVGGDADFASVAAATTFSFVVPDTVVTLSGPLPADATDIAGDSISLVYSYSVDDLRNHVLSNSIEVTASVNGMVITPSFDYVDGARGEITIILSRDQYPGPTEHLLAVTLSLSATADGFVLGEPRSIATPFSFRVVDVPDVIVPNTVVTLSGPVPADATDIAGRALSLVFSYSAGNLRDRSLEGGIEVEVEVDGVSVSPAGHDVDEARGRGEIGIVLRRETYSSNGEHQLRVAISTAAEGFALGETSSITVPFNFSPLSTAIAGDGTCQIGILEPGESCRYRGTSQTISVMVTGYQMFFFKLSEIGEPINHEDASNPNDPSDPNIYNLDAIAVGRSYQIIRIYDSPKDLSLDGVTGSMDGAILLWAALFFFANLALRRRPAARPDELSAIEKTTEKALSRQFPRDFRHETYNSGVPVISLIERRISSFLSGSACRLAWRADAD